MGGGTVNNPSNYLGVRPTLYLKADTLYKSGMGTIENPYRITIDE